MKYDIGVVVGRFQVAELTEAHRRIINFVREQCKRCLVVVGISPALCSPANPLDYVSRSVMIQSEFSDVAVAYISDHPSDVVWSQNLDSLIREIYPIGSICLYGGRDSFFSLYHGTNPKFELDAVHNVSGTQTRDQVGKEVVNSIDFRKGVIYATQNQYPRVFPTVDIAVTKKEKDGATYVLLGKKWLFERLSFFGGFVDPSDESLEVAARRELGEEVDVGVGGLKFITTQKIIDWRYPHANEGIITTLFQTDYVYGSCKALEEMEWTRWVELKESNTDLVESSHKKLFLALVSSITGEKDEQKLVAING